MIRWEHRLPRISSARAPVSAFWLEGELLYEHNSSDSSHAYHGQWHEHRHERPAQRTEPEQYVSATTGGAAAKSGSHQSRRSFAVRGTAGTVQRAERGYVHLHLVAAGGTGDGKLGNEWRNHAHQRLEQRRNECGSSRAGRRLSNRGGSSGGGFERRLHVAQLYSALDIRTHQQNPRSVLNAKFFDSSLRSDRGIHRTVRHRQ